MFPRGLAYGTLNLTNIPPALLEPVFRLAEAEFKSFVENLTDLFTEVDPQIPPLPPKDLIYRIYRDVRPKLLQGRAHCFDAAQVRFSNDKTPYKTNFSATFSRSGRKGIFAGCRFLCTSINSRLHLNTLSFRSYVRSFCVLLCLRRVPAESTYMNLQNE